MKNKTLDTTKRVIGSHLIVDIDGVATNHLLDQEGVTQVLVSALKSEGFQVLHVAGHTFPGGGFTSMVLLGESHASIHTYPENGYLAFDLFSCGNRDPHQILQELTSYLGDVHVKKTVATRTSRPSD